MSPTTTAEDYASRYLNDPSKTLFRDALIDRFSNEGETDFATEYNCIIKRISLRTWESTGGDFDSMTGDFDSAEGSFDDAGGGGVRYINPFTLPDDVLSIRRVTWRGYKLDPLPQRNFREVFQNATQQGRPFWYIFNNVGQNQIQLFPAPNEALPLVESGGLFDSTTGDFDSQGGLFDSAGVSVAANLFGNSIDKCFIVEYFQSPDFVDATIPSYFRRRLLKNYILRGCYNKEGQGQNIKASKYFKNRWETLKEFYGELIGELHNKPRKLIVNGISSSYYFPGTPILPIDRFGVSVGTGE